MNDFRTSSEQRSVNKSSLHRFESRTIEISRQFSTNHVRIRSQSISVRVTDIVQMFSHSFSSSATLAIDGGSAILAGVRVRLFVGQDHIQEDGCKHTHEHTGRQRGQAKGLLMRAQMMEPANAVCEPLNVTTEQQVT